MVNTAEALGLSALSKPTIPDLPLWQLLQFAGTPVCEGGKAGFPLPGVGFPPVLVPLPLELPLPPLYETCLVVLGVTSRSLAQPIVAITSSNKVEMVKPIFIHIYFL